jgi:membrane protein
VTLPGFERVSAWDVLTFFVSGLTNPRFTISASAMSYSFFFSLFPLLILFFTILPWLPLRNLEGYVLTYLGQLSGFVPGDVRELMTENMTDSTATNEFRQGDVWLLIINGFLALYGALQGIITMMKSFTKDQHKALFQSRSILQLYGMAVLILVTLATMVLLSVSIFVAGDIIVRYLLTVGWISEGFKAGLLRGFTYLLTLLALFLSVSLIYFLAPATRQRWRLISPGGIVAGFLTLLTFIGFGKFLEVFGRVDRFYGSLGTIIALMIWFYYFSIVLLLGFELNAAISLAKSQPDGVKFIIPKKKRYRSRKEQRRKEKGDQLKVRSSQFKDIQGRN